MDGRIDYDELISLWFYDINKDNAKQSLSAMIDLDANWKPDTDTLMICVKLPLPSPVVVSLCLAILWSIIGTHANSSSAVCNSRPNLNADKF